MGIRGSFPWGKVAGA